jgi:hypothetical protein
MTVEERSILEQLDRILRSEEMRSQIQPIIDRVRKDLAVKKDAVMTWEPIPLAVYGETLPSGVRSSWVFILRAGANTGAERHPNSHQRMMSFAGAGDMQIESEEQESEVRIQWKSNILLSDPAAPLERRWVSIPRNTWHQPVVADTADWVVVSFHTVPAGELIEERRDSAHNGTTKQMRYLEEKQG